MPNRKAVSTSTPTSLAAPARARRRVLPSGGARDLSASSPLKPQQVEERLKAERVQEMLKALPGWKLAREGRAIDRVRQFPAPNVASAYVTFAASLAASRQQPIAIALSGDQVGLTLHGRERQGTRGGLTETVLDLAAHLG